MSNVTIPIIAKPAFGAPCNGCGFCCETEACDLSVKYLGSTAAPCIALEREDGRAWCGLVRNPGKHLGLPDEGWRHDAMREMLSPSFAYALRLGAGCDAEGNQPVHGSASE